MYSTSQLLPADCERTADAFKGMQSNDALKAAVWRDWRGVKETSFLARLTAFNAFALPNGAVN